MSRRFDEYCCLNERSKTATRSTHESDTWLPAKRPIRIFFSTTDHLGMATNHLVCHRYHSFRRYRNASLLPCIKQVANGADSGAGVVCVVLPPPATRDQTARFSNSHGLDRSCCARGPNAIFERNCSSYTCDRSVVICITALWQA